MKILVAAFALTIAIPAAAQTGQPAPDPHAGHTMPADHSQHKQDGHAQHGQVGHSQHKDGQEGKDCCEHKAADGKKMDCCEKAMAGGKMDCCEKHADKKGGEANHQH